MKISMLLVTALLTLFSVTALQINEIYYDPPGYDNNKEFIELYLGNKSLNLSGHVVSDEYSDDTLVMEQYTNSTYAIIVEEGFDYSGLNCSVYSAGATIGNNLNNLEDSVFIYDNSSNLLDTVSYSGEIDGNFSINLYNSSWIPEEPSPCSPLVIETKNKTVNKTNKTTCDYSLGIETGKNLYEDETIHFNHNIFPEEPENFSITYFIQDLYGDIVREPYTTKNTNSKSFTPKEDGAVPYKVISKLEVHHCNDTNSTDNKAERLFIHKSEDDFNCPSCPECRDCECDCPVCDTCSCPSCPVHKNLETRIDFLGADHSGNLTVRFFAQKGDTRKTAIYVYAKAGRFYFTEKYTVYLEEKNTNRFFDLSLKEKDVGMPDNVTLFIEGLGITINRTIKLRQEENSYKLNSTCPELSRLEDNTSRKNTIELRQQPSRIDSRVIYESEDSKRVQMIPYFLLACSVLLNVFLLLQKRQAHARQS